MVNIGDQVIEDTSYGEERILNMLGKSLPPYAVACFKNAGYDNAPAIMQMTTEGPQNTLDQIEEFIIKHYPDDQSCYPPTIARNLSNVPNFIFLPGHRILIANFINDFKAREQLNSRLSRKRAATCQSAAVCHPAVKNKCTSPDPTSSEESLPQQSHDLQFVYNDIRKRIIQWMKKEPSIEIKELKEHTDYSVVCTLDNSNNVKATVRCTLCRKDFQLTPKTKSNGNKVMLLSNWTSHIKQCVKKNKGTLEQPEIDTFLQSRCRNDSLTSNNQQRKSLDQTNTTAGNVNNDDSSPIVTSPQRNQQLLTLLLDSQDSQLASPQPVVPQHCQNTPLLFLIHDMLTTCHL